MGISRGKSLHGDALFFDANDPDILGARCFVGGVEPGPSVYVESGYDIVAKHEEFLGDTGSVDVFCFVEDDTGGNGLAGTIVSATNGVYRIKATGGAAPGRELQTDRCAAITWGAQRVKMDARDSSERSLQRLGVHLKMNSVSRTAPKLCVFLGWSDSGGAELPFYDSGNGLTARATDGFGALFSGFGDTGWTLVGARNGTLQHDCSDTGLKPATNSYTTVELEYRADAGDTGGRVTMFIDGRPAATLDSPCTSSVGLTPWIGICNLTADTGILDVDYVNYAGVRDTGA